MRTRPPAAVLASLALAIAATTLLVPDTATAVPLVESDEECDVTAGESIQDAIHNASPYSRVVVCEATYYQNATIPKDGIQLLGKGTPILDGSLHTGPRNALRLADGVDDATIYSFEIRAFDDPLNDTDKSSGIVLEGNHTNVTVWGNDVHDNAWTGLRSLTGPITDLDVVSNKFDAHGLSHTFLHQVRNLTVRNNTAVSSDQAFAVSEGHNVTLRNNTVEGGGNGAYVFPPPLDGESWTTDVTFRNNTADNKWTHGVWTVGLRNATFVHNNFTINGTDLTLGGLPSHYTLWNNSQIELTTNITPAYNEFDTTLNLTYDLDCLNCTVSTLDQLFDDALTTLLNPQADAEDQEDIDRLAACEGENATCLRDRFFDPNATTTPNNWTVTIESHPLLPDNATLRFIDAGVRAPGADTAYRHHRAPLDANWTSLVLCRLETDDRVHRCDAAPTEFDFGLDQTWAPTDLPRHASYWRLKNPTTAVHDTFDSLHGPDATLFKQTTPVHTKSSSPPPNSLESLLAIGTGSSPPEWAGNAYLECRIQPGDEATKSTDCRDPQLLEDATEPSLLWCTGSLPNHNRADHDTMGDERWSADLWDWSDTCQPANPPETVTWPRFLDSSDLRALAHAHAHYFAHDEPLGQAGTTSGLGNSIWASESLSFDFQDRPLVFATTQTINGDQDPSAAHVRNVTKTGFETQHCEWDLDEGCDTHAEETNGWIAIDPPRVADHIPLEAGNVTVSDHEAPRVTFQERFDQTRL